MSTSLQKTVVFPSKGKYVVGVSGGVDSVTLLNIMASKPEYELVVAHFDHGIRHNSKQDCEFVAKLARKYNLLFEHSEGKLGKNATEEQARNARYNFFNIVAKKHNADSIITAQHLDDAIETMIFNILRGTHEAGLAPFTTNTQVLRPLRNIYKKDIIRYAQSNKLDWREDETNKDTGYSRNYIRHILIPMAEDLQPGSKQKLAEIIKEATAINSKKLAGTRKEFLRYTKIKGGSIIFERQNILLLDENKLLSLITMAIQKLHPEAIIDTKKLKLLELFAKTARVGKQYKVSKKLRAISGHATLSITLSETV